MEAERAIVEIERLIEKGQRQSRNDQYWRELYGAELRGVQQAREDLGKADGQGKDQAQYLRERLQAFDGMSDWSLSLEMFERSIAVRMGYKEVLDAVVLMRSRDRIHPRQVARTVREVSGQEIEP